MVSVLVLSWNHEKFIEQCLRSVINQTYKNIEIIFLDNNSADDTFLIAESILQQSGINYRAYKTNENFSIPRNFNFLFSKCHGEYICILSGDDWLHIRNIEQKLKAFADGAAVGMVDSIGYRYYDEIDVYELIPLPAFVKKEDTVAELLKRNFISGIGCIIRTDVIKAVGGWDETLLIDDSDMWIKIAMKYEIKVLEGPLFFYRQHVNGISKNADFMYEGKMQLYHKYAHLNNHKEITLKNIKENYLSNKVRTGSSLSLAWKIIKNFKPNKFYTKLLIKSLLPVSFKRNYFLQSLKKNHPGKPILY
ncbi:MAG TPA: glycosyltransferase family A protein [Chitinophagaceae bacterium]|nr:glycosyltransferase family A protein [Chitinophagaceae bacterium]